METWSQLSQTKKKLINSDIVCMEIYCANNPIYQHILLTDLTNTIYFLYVTWHFFSSLKSNIPLNGILFTVSIYTCNHHEMARFKTYISTKPFLHSQKLSLKYKFSFFNLQLRIHPLIVHCLIDCSSTCCLSLMSRRNPLSTVTTSVVHFVFARKKKKTPPWYK